MLQRDAYYHPTVDNSDEPFKWGLPDLDALRMFFKQELGWGETKVDELLLPIIQKMNRRHTNTSGTASGVQGSLSDWVSSRADNNTDAANLAPRKKDVYTSRRLQQVVADFRKRRKAGSVAPSQAGSGSDQEDGDSEPAKKRQRKPTKSSARGGKVSRGRGRGRGGSAGATRKGKRKRRDEDDYSEGSEEDDGENNEPQVPEASAASLRPRPRPRPRPVTESLALGSDIDVD